MSSLKAVSGVAAVAGLAAILLAVAIAGAATNQTFTDPPNDVVHIDEASNPLTGAVTPVSSPLTGHRADITGVQVIQNATVEICVTRPNKTEVSFSTFVAIFFVAEDSDDTIVATWGITDGVETTSVFGMEGAVEGTISSADGGMTVCAEVSSATIPTLKGVGARSYDRPSPTELRGYDQAGPYDLPEPTPTATATATDVPPTATPTDVPPTATQTQPAPTATATQPAPTATATTAAATATPGPPATGTGTVASSLPSLLLAAGVLALLVAAGTAGLAYARRGN